MADFDRDEPPEILWQHETSGDLEIWTMDGSTRTAVVRPSPDNWDEQPHLVAWARNGIVKSGALFPEPNVPDSNPGAWRTRNVCSADS